MPDPLPIAPISSPSEKPRKRIWRWEGVTLAVLFGVGLILWPFMSFGAIFMFDSPTRSLHDLAGRYTVAYFIWLYPVTYGITVLAYFILRRIGVWRLLSLAAFGFPVLAWSLIADDFAKKAEPSNAQRIQLLYRTDYAALLAACRDMMTNSNTSVERRENKSIDNFKDPRVPAIIAALKPEYIAVGDDEVFLGLHGGSQGFDHYGVDSTTTNGMYNGGNYVLLKPSLWYYDETFSYPDTNRAAYLGHLRSLKPADAPPPNW